MRVPDQASTAAGQAVAIAGAALRFPGASDPASFHELTVTGRRMFREFGRHPGSGRRTGPGPAGRPTPPDGQPLLAALLDDSDSAAAAGGTPADATMTGQVIAAGTAAAALADLPAAGRSAAPGRIGVFLAGLTEREAADVTQWVRSQLAIR